MPSLEQVSDLMSPSQQFLQRVEQQRQERECFCLLDLRKLSSNFCRRYSYRGRSMWLDSEAQKKFMVGLESNHGAFTVGSYEEILNAYQSIDPETQVSQPRVNWPEASHEMKKVSSGNHRKMGHSAVFELGYFEKRAGGRVKHITPILLLVSGKIIPAETRNISFQGLKVRAKIAIQVQAGDLIKIKLSPTVISSKKFSTASYRVVKTELLLSDTMLSLACEESESNETVDYFQQIVSSYTGKSPAISSMDAEDDLLTSHSTLAERYYMRSSTIIPLFLFKTSSKAVPLKIVFSNRNNLQLLSAFETSTGNHDLSPLARHSFIKLLVKLARRDSQADTLLVVCRSEPGASPVTFIQSEFKESDDWYRFLSSHRDQPGFFVFKVVARHIHSPNSHRILSDLNQLTSKSTDLSAKLTQEAKNLYIAGSLVDVTEQIRSWDLTQILSDNPVEPLRQIILNKVDEPLPAPEIWPVSFVEEKRSENRFTGQIRVDINFDGNTYGAQTRDLSVHGLSVFSDEPDIPVKLGSQLQVSFPDLKKKQHLFKNRGISYKDVPYELIEVVRGDPTLLRMKQRSDEKSNKFSHAISSFIEQRRTKLPVELSHLYRSTASRFYSSHFIESPVTIPLFFIEKNTEQQLSIKVGVVQSPSYLTGFFEIADGEFDFDSLTDQHRLEKLIEKIAQDGRAEIALLLYKERIPGTNRFRIRQIEEGAVDKSTLQASFVNYSSGVDFRYLKLVASRPQSPPKAEIEQAIDRLQHVPKSKTDQLLSDFSNLVAIGDIVDITGQFQALQSFSLNQKQPNKV